MEWQVLEGIGGLATAAAVVVALAFGIHEARDNRRRDRMQATFEQARLLQSRELVEAGALVRAIPRGATRAEVEAMGAHVVTAVHQVCNACENMALMVDAGIMDETLVNDTVPVGSIWARLEQYVRDLRADEKDPHLWAWFEWLSARLRDQPARSPPPVPRAGDA